jgi:hypothetical protein
VNLVEIIKASVGPLLVLALVFLGWHIVHGAVTEAESFGLMPIIIALAAGLGAWGTWAFQLKGAKE